VQVFARHGIYNVSLYSDGSRKPNYAHEYGLQYIGVGYTHPTHPKLINESL
jgi:hypothetical protein